MLMNVLREHPEIVRIFNEIIVLAIGSIALVVAIHALLKLVFKRRGQRIHLLSHDREYLAVGLHLTSLRSLAFPAGVWFATLSATAVVGSKLLHADTIVRVIAGQQVTIDLFAVATALAGLITFAVVAVAYFALRFLYRLKLKRAIMTRSFSESFIPPIMDVSLARRALLPMLYRGPIIPHHETLHAPA